MPNPRTLLVAAAALAAMIGCKAEPITLPPSAQFAFSFDDPPADTLGQAATTTKRAIDARQFGGTVDPSDIVVVLSFMQPITPYSAKTAASVEGYVDLDMDENPKTGIPAYADEQQIGTTGLGADYYVDLNDDGAGHVAFVNVATQQATPVQVTYSASSLTVRIPRELVGRDDGNFRAAAVVGTSERPTDLLPNTGYYGIHP